MKNCIKVYEYDLKLKEIEYGIIVVAVVLESATSNYQYRLFWKALLLSRYSSSVCQQALLLSVSCSALSVACLPELLIGQKPALLLGFSLVVLA